MELFYDQFIRNFPSAPMESVKAYSSDSISLIETNYLPYGEFYYDHYHFIIPVSEMPAVLTESKLINIRTGAMFPCNPGQHHRALESNRTGGTYYSLDLSGKLVRSAAESMFNSSNLEFTTNSFNLPRELSTLIRSFREEHRMQQAGYELVLQTLSLQMAVALLRYGSHNLSANLVLHRNHYEKKLIDRAKEYLEENISGSITLEELASELNYSSFHFLRLFKASTGMTPFEYLMDIKIEKAKRLLKESNHTVTEICSMCGFKYQSHFAQAFGKRTGVSPSLYRKNI